MQKTAALSLIFVFIVGAFYSYSSAATPLPPDAGAKEKESSGELQSLSLEHANDPMGIVIPSIGLGTSVEEVGINSKGEMDVPDGKSKNVGWYKYGTVPGKKGSAVMDAHVYAAFKNLKHAKVGDDVYVLTKSGEQLHFVIEKSTVYERDVVPLELLFNRSDDARLNLITCAGKFDRKADTYTHRLVVYAKLVE